MHTPWQIHHLDFISQFTSDIRYVSRTENAAADALSRIGVNSLNDTSPVLGLGEMAKAQRDDTELHKLQSSPSSLVFKQVPLPQSDSTIICDTSTGVPRPFVPSKFRRAVFNSLHSLSHLGIRATQRLITARFIWPGINRDVRTWAKTCVH